MDEVVKPAATVGEWLSSLPLAASAGSAVSSFYEDSKNYNCVTQYALGTVESSVKMAASAIAPVVKSLDKPIHAVDSYAASKLVQLEEKVPAVKSQPEEVIAYFNETKDALTGKIMEGRSTVSLRLSEGKDGLSSRFSSGKEAVYAKLASGAQAISNSSAGVAVSESKQAIANHLSHGKEVLGNTVAAGCEVVSAKIQNGAELLANTRAGTLLGSGADSALTTTENWVEYLLPESGDEDENGEKEVITEGLPDAGQPPSDDCPAQEEGTTGRIARVCSMSRKVRMRVYYRSMQRLQAMQKNCKSTLEQLQQTVDLLKLAQAARDGMDKQYQTMTTALRDFEQQLQHLLYRHSKSEVSWPPKDEEEEGVKVEWLDPKPKPEGGYVQSSLDYAKQLSEKVFHTFQSVTIVTTYLPSHLKGGATQGYHYAKELYTTLKPVNSPVELTGSALNRISSLLETQLGYVTQLGNYLTSVLQKGEVSRPVEVTPPTEDVTGEDGDNESSDSETG